MAAVAADPLPSWNDGATKKSIVDFVGRVTKEGGPDLVRPARRIATFDNDGTLWSEKPVPFEVVFAFNQVKALAPQHPEWRTKAPFASVLGGELTGVAASGEKGVLAIIAATHTGMTTDELSATVRDWIATAKHPQTQRLFTDMVYQPMLVGIQRRIGRRPIAAFGNSDSDLQMLQWATVGAGVRFCALRPPRRCGAGVRLRSRGQVAAVQQGVGRGGGQGLDGREYEKRLEDRVSRRVGGRPMIAPDFNS